MNIDKISMYNRISNSYPEISDNAIAYCYSKKGNGIELQEFMIRCFLEQNGKEYKKIFFDSGVSNLLKSKTNLQKILNLKDIDIVVLSLDRLTRNSIEFQEINSICKENNIKIFGIKQNLFLSDLDDLLSLYPYSKKRDADKELDY